MSAHLSKRCHMCLCCQRHKSTRTVAVEEEEEESQRLSARNTRPEHSPKKKGAVSTASG